VFLTRDGPSSFGRVRSDQDHGSSLIWAGILCIVPVTLFRLVSEGTVAITPLTLLGAVLLTVGLVRRDRSSPNEPTLPPIGQPDPDGSSTSRSPTPSARGQATMKRAVGYLGLVLGWLLAVAAVGFGGGTLVEFMLHSGDFTLWRLSLFALGDVVLCLVAYLLIRWVRSILGTPSGSRPARVVLGIVLLVLAIPSIVSPSTDPDTGALVRDYVEDFVRGESIATVLFGALLIAEAWLHRASRVSATPLPDAPTTRADPIARSDIVLPEPPPDL
jgi:hypothetical protein